MLQSLQVPRDRGSGLAVSGKTMVSAFPIPGKGLKKFIRHIGKLAMLNSVSKMAAVLSWDVDCINGHLLVLVFVYFFQS